jgi:hypothetical protein
VLEVGEGEREEEIILALEAAVNPERSHSPTACSPSPGLLLYYLLHSISYSSIYYLFIPALR